MWQRPLWRSLEAAMAILRLDPAADPMGLQPDSQESLLHGRSVGEQPGRAVRARQGRPVVPRQVRILHGRSVGAWAARAIRAPRQARASSAVQQQPEHSAGALRGSRAVVLVPLRVGGSQRAACTQQRQPPAAVCSQGVCHRHSAVLPSRSRSRRPHSICRVLRPHNSRLTVQVNHREASLHGALQPQLLHNMLQQRLRCSLP